MFKPLTKGEGELGEGKGKIMLIIVDHPWRLVF
jgi:hypothetical protein